MILILGAGGYIGRAFVAACESRELEYSGISRAECDYTRYDRLTALLRESKPEFLVNAAGFTGKPNVDACEVEREATLLGNAVLPQTIACACETNGVRWFHVSSGCIYNGAKLEDAGATRIVEDLSAVEVRALLDSEPDRFRGFREEDEPNFSFASPPCSFYSGSKAVAERILAGFDNVCVGRLRIPFDEFDSSRNFLSKLLRYAKVYDNVNSISHRGQFVNAALDLMLNRAPMGVYNMTNPGFVSAREVVGLLSSRLVPDREFDFWEDDAEFYREPSRTPRSNCILETAKLSEAGVAMKPALEALDDALANWKWEEGRQ